MTDKCVLSAYHADEDDEGDVRLYVNTNERWRGAGAVYASERLVNYAPQMLAGLKAAQVVLLFCAAQAGDDAYWNEGGQGYAVYTQVNAALDAAKGDN